VVLTALMYALGLSSCSAASHLLGALGAAVGKSKVRSLQDDARLQEPGRNDRRHRTYPMALQR
jgi:hypothetical protein